jgi:hypothetical protein
MSEEGVVLQTDRRENETKGIVSGLTAQRPTGVGKVQTEDGVSCLDALCDDQTAASNLCEVTNVKTTTF